MGKHRARPGNDFELQARQQKVAKWIIIAVFSFWFVVVGSVITWLVVTA